MTVHYFKSPLDGDGGSGNDGGMETRMRTVENTLSAIQATLPHLATKSDLGELKSSIMGWAIGTIISLSALMLAVLPRLIAPQVAAQPQVIVVSPPAPVPAGPALTTEELLKKYLPPPPAK